MLNYKHIFPLLVELHGAHPSKPEEGCENRRQDITSRNIIWLLTGLIFSAFIFGCGYKCRELLRFL